MLLSFLGTPSPLPAAVLKCLQALAETRLGAYHWIAAGSPDELKAAWAAREAKPVLLFSDIPSAEISALLIQSNAPVVVALERPEAIVRAVATGRDIVGLPALRFASQSLATLHDLALSPRAWRLGPEAGGAPIGWLIEGLGRHLGIGIDGDTVQRVASRVLPGGRGPEAPVQALMTEPDLDKAREEASLAATALAGFAALLAGEVVTHFAWPPEVFLGDRPHGEPLRGPVELVGGRRCFAFGPFFHLPRGRWRARIDFVVAENVSGNELKVDVYTDKVVAEAKARLPREGRYAVSIEFAVEEPRLPLQLRLFVEEGAIEGRFELIGASVDRLAEPARAR